MSAGRVAAAGRSEYVLASPPEPGADDTIRLDGSRQELADAFAHAVKERPFDVVIDYLWGKPVTNLAEGKLRIETWRKALADVEAVWNTTTPGRRIVLIP